MHQTYSQRTYNTYFVYNTTMNRKYFGYFNQQSLFVRYDDFYKISIGLCSIKDDMKNSCFLPAIPLCIGGILEK